MSNRNQPQQPQNLRRTINTGLRAQNNNYDKIWYAISEMPESRNRNRTSSFKL